MTPQSRKQQILTQRVGEELVIYDERTHDAHRLNGTAAQVWEMADGVRTVPELATALRTNLATGGHAAIEAEESETLVRLALEDLDRAGLLVRAIPPITESMTRRQMLVVAAALLPVVASIVAPTPAMAQSFFPPPSPTPTPPPGNTSGS